MASRLAIVPNAAPDASPVTRGFRAPCIKCGDPDCVRVDLSDLSAFTCHSCDDTFTADDVREHIAQWSSVLAWIEAAPSVD